MRIFCKKAQGQIRLKLTVELLVLWPLDMPGICALACRACFAQGCSLVLFQNDCTLVFLSLFHQSLLEEVAFEVFDPLQAGLLTSVPAAQR